MEASVSADLVEKNVDHMEVYRALTGIRSFREDTIDPLILLLYITLEPMKFKIILLIMCYVTCQFSFALCLTIYRMISTFDKKILLRHGSFGGIEIFVLINLWTVLLKYKEIMSFCDIFQLTRCPLNEKIVGAEKYREVRWTVLILKLIVLVDYGLALIAAFGFTLSPEYFNTRTYLAVWLRENFPDYSERILFVIHMSNFPVALVLCALSIAMSYFGYNAVLQLIFTNQAVEGICASSIPLNERFSSELYQHSVKIKMKICIILHILAIRMSRKAAELIYIPMIAFSLGGVILGGSLLLEFFTNDSSEMSNQYLGIICFTLAGTISSSLYVSSGQHLKNESERTLYILNQLPWYYMNKENKQIFSIFSKMAEKPISMSTSLLEINFLLLVRIFKAIYSIAALIAQFVTTTSGSSQ